MLSEEHVYKILSTQRHTSYKISCYISVYFLIKLFSEEESIKYVNNQSNVIFAYICVSVRVNNLYILSVSVCVTFYIFSLYRCVCVCNVICILQ